MTGRRFVDHLAFIANGDDAELVAFCKKQNIPAPMGGGERKKLAKIVKAIDAQFEAAKKKATAKSAAPREKKPAATLVKGPRPLSRTLAACVLDDGHVFVVTAEDFGNAYGQRVSHGATFLFDPSTSTFTAHTPRADADALTPILAFPVGEGALVVARRLADEDIVSMTWNRASSSWSELTPVPINGEFGFVGRTLEDGSALLFGGGGNKSALYNGGRWKKLADLPESRARDQIVPWGAGRLLVGCGTIDEDSTDKTLVFDVAKRTWSRGPSLPEPTRGQLVPRADGGVTLIDDEQRFWTLTKKKFERAGEIPELTEIHDLHTVTGPDRLVTVRWTDRSVLEIDLVKLKARVAGHVLLGKASVALPLRDERILFLGGTLFANLEAEPEIWDAADGKSSPIAGYDQEVAKQAAALAKNNEKDKKKGFSPWARGVGVTG